MGISVNRQVRISLKLPLIIVSAALILALGIGMSNYRQASLTGFSSQ